MRGILLGGAVLGVGLAVSFTASAETFRLLRGWDPGFAAVERVMYPFVERLEEASSGEISIRDFGPETVSPFEQLEPVAQGAFDMLYTNGAYHSSDTAVGMVLDALEGNGNDLRDTGIYDFVDSQYQEMGLKFLGVVFDRNGYHIMLNEPLDEDVFEGRRIRGTPVYHPVIEAFGGSPVVLPGGEIYTALERGVVDGAAWPVIGAVDFRWYEVADYMMRPSFGQAGYMIFMNLDRWNSLDPETQELISDVAREFESEGVELFNQVASKEEGVLESEGMSVTELDPGLHDKLNEAWFDGAMDLGAEKSPEPVETIRKMALDNDLAP